MLTKWHATGASVTHFVSLLSPDKGDFNQNVKRAFLFLEEKYVVLLNRIAPSLIHVCVCLGGGGGGGGGGGRGARGRAGGGKGGKGMVGEGNGLISILCPFMYIRSC